MSANYSGSLRVTRLLDECLLASTCEEPRILPAQRSSQKLLRCHARHHHIMQVAVSLTASLFANFALEVYEQPHRTTQRPRL